jgi:26S proteasome regulatory subunit N1
MTGILSTGHYMLYYVTPAIQPRMLVTFDESLSPLSVSVRVGQVSYLVKWLGICNGSMIGYM